MKEKISLERIAMNIVYQLDDDAGLSVEFRQANNDKRIDFVMSLVKECAEESYKRGYVNGKNNQPYGINL